MQAGPEKATEATPLAPGLRGSKPDGKEESAPFYVYFVSFCAALNSVNLGFDIGVNSGVALLIQRDLGLSDVQVGIFMGSLHFVAACGGLLNQWISDRIGRCRTFTSAQVACLIGIVILCCAKNFGTLMTGRLVMGLGIGISMAIDPLYIAEVAPATHRGRLTTWSEISINMGIMLGFVVNWLLVDLPSGVDWRVMLACGLVLPLLVLVLSLTVMPESPRWLAAHGREADAREVLRRSHPVGEDVEALVSEIRRALRTEEEHKRLGWAPLLCPDAPTRRILAVGVGVAFAQQINGSESIVLYSPEVFRQAGVAKTAEGLFLATIFVGFVKMLFIVVSACFLDTAGRRPLLILSTTAMALCEWLLALGLQVSITWLSVGSVLVFMAAFSVGVGPVAWLLAAEVFPNHLRAKGMSLAAFTNRMTSALVALTFLPLSDLLGLPGYYVLFGSLTALTAVGAYAGCPETKGKTLEQLAQQFGAVEQQ